MSDSGSTIAGYCSPASIFPSPSAAGSTAGCDAYRSGNTEVDDRGVIYIRQGEPAERLRPFVFGAMPNESWHYIRAEGDLLFHFSSGYDGNGGGDLYDYRLVESVLDLHGAADAPTDQLILSRQSLSPIYSRMLNWGRFGAAKARARERSIGATSIEVGTTTDSHELQFARRLAAVADLVAVGRRPAGSLAHVVFGIAAGTSGPSGGWRREVPGSSPPGRSGSTGAAGRQPGHHARDPAPAAAQRGEWLVGRAELMLPRDAGATALHSSRATAPASCSRETRCRWPTPMARRWRSATSHSALRAGPSPGSPTAADTVLLAPSALFRQGSELELYYEVTGAHRTVYSARRCTVLRGDESRPRTGDAIVTLWFDEGGAPVIVTGPTEAQRLKSSVISSR